MEINVRCLCSESLHSVTKRKGVECVEFIEFMVNSYGGSIDRFLLCLVYIEVELTAVFMII